MEDDRNVPARIRRATVLLLLVFAIYAGFVYVTSRTLLPEAQASAWIILMIKNGIYGLLIGVTLGLLTGWLLPRASKKSFWRFDLRSLLIVTTLIAIALGAIGYALR